MNRQSQSTSMKKNIEKRQTHIQFPFISFWNWNDKIAFKIFTMYEQGVSLILLTKWQKYYTRRSLVQRQEFFDSNSL